MENVVLIFFFRINPFFFLSQVLENPSGAKTRLFWYNKANNMAADVLAPCVA